eukprot:356126-Chlamydomonas_euryale.AAC.5
MIVTWQQKAIPDHLDLRVLRQVPRAARRQSGVGSVKGGAAQQPACSVVCLKDEPLHTAVHPQAAQHL